MNKLVTLMQMLQMMMDPEVMQKKILIVMVTVQQMLTVQVIVLEQPKQMNVVFVKVMASLSVGMDLLYVM